jgi:hypothetical protein
MKSLSAKTDKCFAWEFYCSHINDQHTKLKLISTVFRALVIVREFVPLGLLFRSCLTQDPDKAIQNYFRQECS